MHSKSHFSLSLFNVALLLGKTFTGEIVIRTVLKLNRGRRSRKKENCLSFTGEIVI